MKIIHSKEETMKITFIDRELLVFEVSACGETLIRRKTIIEVLSEPDVYRVLINQSLN